MTEERLAELERAAANAQASYHEDCALYVRASELAELCQAARYGHDNETWMRLRRESEVAENKALREALEKVIELHHDFCATHTFSNFRLPGFQPTYDEGKRDGLAVAAILAHDTLAAVDRGDV